MTVSITDEDVPENLEQYWLSLGRFIHRFASLESKLQTVLWMVTDTHPLTAKAIFSGVKSDAARNLINRTREANGQAPDPNLDRAFQQIGIITGMRNDIVHYGADFAMDASLLVSNEKTAMPGRGRTTVISSKILDDMTVDLRTIQALLNVFIFSIIKPRPGEKLISLWDEIARRPWQYKPKPQAGARQQRQSRNPKRATPPESSPK